MSSRRMIFGRYDYVAWLSFASYACCSVVIPIALKQLASDLNFNLEGEGNKGLGGALQIGRSMLMVVAMLYCGFAAGRWGKYTTMGAALLLMGGGILLVTGAQWYWMVLIAVAIAGLGEGVIEGLATPFVQDLHPREPGRYINFTHSFWSVGVLFMSILCGVLLTMGVNWRWVVGLAGSIALIPAIVLLLPDRRPGARPGHDERKSFAVVFREAMAVMRVRRFWIFFAAMFLAGGGEFCLTFWLPSYLELDYGTRSITAAAALACFAAAMFTGRMASGYLVHQNHLNRLVTIAGLVGVAVSSMIPLLIHLPSRELALVLMFVLVTFSGFCAAPLWPSIQSYCCDRMPENDSTMIFILLSCAGVPGCGFFTWLMGAVGDRVGLNAALFLVPGCFGLMSLLLIGQWLIQNREKRRR